MTKKESEVKKKNNPKKNISKEDNKQKKIAKKVNKATSYNLKIEELLEKNSLSLYIVIGFIALIVIIIILSSHKKEVLYPVVFSNKNGELLLIENDNQKSITLSTQSELSSIVYPNTTDEYLLFKKNQNLQLYTKKEKESTIKIVQNVSSYNFTEDDEYIISLDKDKNLYAYNYKENTLLEKEIDSLVHYSNKYILYLKSSALYIIEIKNPNNKIKISKDSKIAKIGKDNKIVIFLDNNNRLYQYNVARNKKEIISKNAQGFLCSKQNCQNILYASSEKGNSIFAIFSYNGKNSKKLVSEAKALIECDVKNNLLIYLDKNEKIKFQNGDSKPVIIDKNIQGYQKVKLFKQEGIYYTNSKKDIYYREITGNSLKEAKKVTANLYGDFYETKKGYAILTNEKNGQANLSFIENGHLYKIDKNVSLNHIKISNKGDKVIYLKNYKDNKGELYISSYNSKKMIDKNIYQYNYVSDKKIYYIKDYNNSKKSGKLFRYTNKSTKLSDDVKKIITTPNKFELSR